MTTYGPFDTEDEARAYVPPTTLTDIIAEMQEVVGRHTHGDAQYDADWLFVGALVNAASENVDAFRSAVEKIGQAFTEDAGRSLVGAVEMAAEYREDWTNAATGERHEVAP